MTKLAIASVEACAPKPFKTCPYLMLILADDAGTEARYFQPRPADTDMEALKEEALRLELGGTIEEDTLDADWIFDAEGIAADLAQHEGDAEGAEFDNEGPPAYENEFENEIEPVA